MFTTLRTQTPNPKSHPSTFLITKNKPYIIKKKYNKQSSCLSLKIKTQQVYEIGIERRESMKEHTHAHLHISEWKPLVGYINRNIFPKQNIFKNVLACIPSNI